LSLFVNNFEDLNPCFGAKIAGNEDSAAIFFLIEPFQQHVFTFRLRKGLPDYLKLLEGYGDLQKF
jgi:hypothetical protein